MTFVLLNLPKFSPARILVSCVYIDHHTRCLIFYPIALNSPDSKDTDIAAITDSVVECIFSVLVTLGRYSQEFMNS